MPSRLLREGILDSERVNSLSWAAEVFYRRLMSVVDDYGRFDARIAVLRTRLYPIKVETVNEKDIAAWLAECESAGLVHRYTANGKPFLHFRGLGSPRARESKYPPPSDTATTGSERALENGCVQVLSDAPYSGSGTGSDSGSKEDSSEPATPASEPVAVALPPELPILEIPCVGKGSKSWPLTASKVAEWGDAYPGIDVVAECRKARQWCIDNPGRRKTFDGMTRFLGTWLSKAQNERGRGPPAGGTKSRGESQDQYAARLAATAFGGSG